MKVLITAGGTSEKIDEVRSITNHSTGQLGIALASAFSKLPNTQITYLCGEKARRPKLTNTTILPIQSASDLLTILTQILTEEEFDIIIHGMAVSDFQLEGAFTIDDFAEILTAKLIENLGPQNIVDPRKNPEWWQNCLAQALKEMALPKKELQSKKLSSSSAKLFLSLTQTPKVIAYIRKLQPKAVFVGFKLLVSVSEAELQKVGSALLHKNGCDFVLANDLKKIHGQQHFGLLIDKNGQTQKAETKTEIADLIVQATTNQMGGKKNE